MTQSLETSYVHGMDGLTIEALVDAPLALEPVGVDRYRAGNVDTGHGVIFGGQLLAQSVIAGRTAEPGKAVKTVHTIFARIVHHRWPGQIPPCHCTSE